MRHAGLVLVAVLAASRAAHAAPLATPPAGWTGGASTELVEQTGRIPHFGGVHGVIEAERYDAPRPGVVLYVTRVAANTASPQTAAQAELANAHPGKESSAQETKAEQHADAARRELEATVAWRDPGTQVTGTVRLVVAATGSRVVAIQGECLAAGDAEPALVQACTAALATLDPAIDPKDRVALALAPATEAPPAGPPPTTLTPATLTDGSHVTLPPMSMPQDAPPTDRRPVYVGLGIAILAAMFWWNSRRRARFEREDEGQEPDDR